MQLHAMIDRSKYIAADKLDEEEDKPDELEEDEVGLEFDEDVSESESDGDDRLEKPLPVKDEEGFVFLDGPRLALPVLATG
ncbi:hypothetical protein FRC20_003187 [Serendipita sp. 405]|nr:hypothetical protein FRC20_003187 [Serendipita sp. 405]